MFLPWNQITNLEISLYNEFLEVWIEVHIDHIWSIALKVHQQISKNGVSKSIVLVIKPAKFQLYRVYPDGVI